MAPVLVRGGPIAPGQIVRGFLERTVHAQRAARTAVVRVTDPHRWDRVLTLNVARARAVLGRDPNALALGAAIAVAQGVIVVHALSVAIGPVGSIVPGRAVVRIIGGTVLARPVRTAGIDLDQHRAIPALRPGTQVCLDTVYNLIHGQCLM